MQLIVSDSHDPFLNLAYEYELLNRAVESESFLFIYRNNPCVVIGRFQNPWKELKFSKMSNDIKFVRRHSGGGTVYHDLGNWNFSFIKPGTKINEIENLNIITNALAEYGINAQINERFDIVINADDSLKKISGSAFRRVRYAHLHHGTLLFDANLTSLKGLLGKDRCFNIEDKGVASVPSQVLNLSELDTALNFDLFLMTLQEQLGVPLQVLSSDESTDLTLHHYNTLTSWAWQWGQGPKAKFEIKGESGIGLSFDLANGQFENVFYKSIDGEIMSLAGLNGQKIMDISLSSQSSTIPDAKLLELFTLNFCCRL